MSIFTKIFGITAKPLIDSIGGVIDGLHTSGEEKATAKRLMAELVFKRDAENEASARTVIQSKERILIAELEQGDNYTKRARPTVVYGGLVIIFWTYCVLPTIAFFTGTEVPVPTLPIEFWGTWGGLVGTWIIGRSAEKRAGKRNGLSRLVTGSSKISSILDE